MVSSRLMTRERRRILEFAAAHRLPLATGWGAWAEDGALFTYGPNINDIVRRSAGHVDRILRGAQRAERKTPIIRQRPPAVPVGGSDAV